MTKQDLNAIALTDEELEAAAGGAGKWVPPTRGQWWVWQESHSSVNGNSAGLHAQSGSSGSITRRDTVNGQSQYVRFDGNKEIVVGIR